jgi:MFS family permease
VQALTTFAVLALPTLAIKAAPTFGIGPESVGYQLSIIYIVAATMSSLSGLLVRRYGAGTTSLASLALSGLGLLGISTGSIVIAIFASFCMGMGYSLTNPSASHLLLRFAPPHRQNLVFAVKQTGVPLGGILAALMLPYVSEHTGWQVATGSSVILVMAVSLPLWQSRSHLDSDRNPSVRVSGRLLEGLRIVLADPVLRALATMGSFYGWVQFCLFAFLITMLVQEFAWTLMAAGGMATATHVAGAVGRVAWSMLADQISRGMQILFAIGLASSALAIVLGLATAGWPPALLGGVLVGLGFCVVGWNGLWMAEIARVSGRQRVSLATGGALVFTFMGVVAGPAAFATAYKFIGSYRHTYAIFALLTLVGAVALLPALRRTSATFRAERS